MNWSDPKKRRLAILFGVGAAVALLLSSCASLLPFAMHACDPDVEYRVKGPAHTLYLTLDDGPSAATDEILAVLAKHGVRATFFITSDHIDPVLMRRIVGGGHALGHHMKTTEKLDRLDRTRFGEEFSEAERRISEFGPIVAFRPPGGAISHEQACFVRESGYPIFAGTIYPLDHLIEDDRKIEWLARRLVTDGGIIVLHDTNKRGARTARALDRLLPYLAKQGYRFETLPNPHGADRMRPGRSD